MSRNYLSCSEQASARMLYLINFSERKSHKEGVKIGLSSLVLKVLELNELDAFSEAEGK